MIHVLTAAIPDSVVRPIADRVMCPLLPQSMDSSADRVAHFYLAAILVLSLVGYALMAGRLYNRLFPGSRHPEVIPVGFLALLLPFAAGTLAHIYDFTGLLLMAALLYAIASHRHWLFLVLFTVSCFNKETTVFAAIAYACYSVDRMPYQAFLPMVLAQGVVFSLIYFGLHHHYAGNPGKGLDPNSPTTPASGRPCRQSPAAPGAAASTTPTPSSRLCGIAGEKTVKAGPATPRAGGTASSRSRACKVKLHLGGSGRWAPGLARAHHAGNQPQGVR